MKAFTHLHVHSPYSIADGISSCEILIAKAVKCGMKSMAITDHGNVSGHMDFAMHAKSFGIKPIFGCEHYFVDDATIKDGDHRKAFHLVLLAKDATGYRNLLKLQALSWHVDHFYYKPRIDWSMLRRHAKGLVCLTACIGGPVGACLLANKPHMALKKTKRLLCIFKDDLYLEIQLHNIIEKQRDLQRIVNEGLIKIAKKLNVPLVLTNDIHYANRGMHAVQAAVIKLRTDSDILNIRCKDLWLKTYDELLASHKVSCSYLSYSCVKAAMGMTQEIADKCNYVIPIGKKYFPKFDHTKHVLYKKWPDLKKASFFKKIVKEAAKAKGVWDKLAYRERIRYEANAFLKTKSVDYLLIIDDLLRHMKKIGCLFHMRGSANGSLVCFLLGFGIVDPIAYGIMFERFISPGRILQGLQDIDIDLDFEAEYRDIAIQYLKDRYGEDHICSVGSFGRLQLKAAIKGIARIETTKIENALNIPGISSKKSFFLKEKLKRFSFNEINKITKSLYVTDIKTAMTSNEDVKAWYENANNQKWFNKYVRPIIGNAYAPSIHPAGVVLTPGKYDELIPVRTQPDKNKNRVYTTQWENSHTYEEFLNKRGIMILDVLGVKTLSVISRTIRDIRKRHKNDLTFKKIPVDDPKIYSSLSKGENLGYFQLGKAALKPMLMDLKPDHIDDLIFLIAADRPGALAAQAHVHYIKRKHGEEEIIYDHKSLKSVLNTTYGVIVYSEHVMRTAVEFAGMTIVEAEELRQIIKAKDSERFNTYKEKFLNGARTKWGESVDKVAQEIWEKFRASSTYLFPLGHSTAYAIYGNATQWLKIYYPLEFFKNYLQYAVDEEYPAIMAAAKKHYDVKFINPNINHSKAEITIRNDKILWSLQSIKHVGQKAAQAIEEVQPFESFVDFLTRVNKRVCNVKVVTALIIAGAFRKFGDKGTLIEAYYGFKKQNVPSQYIDIEEIDWRIRRTEYITYAVADYGELFNQKKVSSYDKFVAAPVGQRIVIVGMVMKKIELKTRKGDPMWLLTLDNFGNSYNVVVWKDFINLLKKQGQFFYSGDIITVSGIRTVSPKGENQLAMSSGGLCYVKVLHRSSCH